MCDCDAVSRYCTHKDGQSARDFLFPVASKLNLGGPRIVEDVVKEARLVDEYRFALDDIEGVIEQLRVRTFPVSRPDYISVDCDAVDPCALSDARYQLVRLHSLTGGLRGIIDRLEV